MESLQKLLEPLDLTPTDVKVYVTLLSHGPVSPSRLAEIMGLHRPQIHSSLKRLISRGLVEVYSGRPTIYRAIDPRTLFRIINDEFKELFSNSKKFIESISSGKNEYEYGVWIFKSKKGLMNRYIKTVEKAEANLAISGDIEFISRLRDYILSAQENGVIVYIIVYDVPGIRFRKNVVRGFNKVKRAVSGDLLVIADTKMGILAQRRSVVKNLPSYGIAVEEPMLIDYLLQDFLYRWMRSKVIIDKNIELPARFTMFKLGLIEVSKFLEKGRKIRGVFKGRWIRKRKNGVIEGRIVKAFINSQTGIAQMHVKVDEGRIYTVGAPDAVVEDFAVNEMLIKEVEI